MGTCKVTDGMRSQDVMRNQSGQIGTRCVGWQVSLRALLVAPRKVVKLWGMVKLQKTGYLNLIYTTSVTGLKWGCVTEGRCCHSAPNTESADTQGEAGSVQVYRGQSVHSQGPHHSWVTGLPALSYNLQKPNWLMFGRPETRTSWLANRSCPDFIHQKSSFSQLFVIGASCLANDSFKDGCIFPDH